MKLDKTEELKDIEYFKNERVKNVIVLHHTVSAVGKNTAEYFAQDKGKSKIAVAYVIDKDGTVYELFDPKYWGWHIGKGSTQAHNEHSIGIELVNEGQLTKLKDGYKWFPVTENGKTNWKNTFKGEAVELKEKWRNEKYFAKYTEKQLGSLKELLNELFVRFPQVQRVFSNSFDYRPELMGRAGVVLHCNLREDKCDLSPAFPLEEFNEFITGKKITVPEVKVDDIQALPLESVNNDLNVPTEMPEI